MRSFTKTRESETMCTLAKHVGIFDGCFCEEQLDGTNSYGNCFCGQNCLQCTRNKQFLSSDVNPYDVSKHLEQTPTL